MMEPTNESSVMKMDVPEFMPVLSAGAHENPALIDEYDRITGRAEHRHLTDADYRDLVALTK